MTESSLPIAASLLFVAAGCASGGGGNPDRGELDAIARNVGVPGAARAHSEPAGTATEEVPAESEPAEPGRAAPREARDVGATAASDGELAIAWVGGEPLDVRDFVARAWLRSAPEMRMLLDQLVVERLTMLEGERLGLRVDSDLVDRRVAEAHQALVDRLAEEGGERSVEEHVTEVLGLDLPFWHRQLRRETLAQLVAERVVRAWSLEQGHALARVAEFETEEQVAAVQAGLAAGRSFEDLARAQGVGPSADEGGSVVLLAKSESSPLARLAWQTEVGAVGGPLRDGTRSVYLRVERRSDAIEGGWRDVGERVEASLVELPVDTFEFIQWRARIAGRYSVDLQPFRELVGAPGSGQ